MERTLAIIKPDAVQRGLVGKILARLEAAGFVILAMKMVYLSKEDAQRFYHVHRERPFFDSLTSYMASGPAVALLLQREGAIASLRELMGATNPAQAAAGTLRHEFGLDVEKNAIHGSDSPETAAWEIPFFFSGLEFRER
ncbi:MAG: nucleoside diphosphate kinase [Candidatus Tectimicrobiota bacterium]|nr:MAG: nucleoside diphosphate kinase [Candidatus Tectomicrobia bacterium]